MEISIGDTPLIGFAVSGAERVPVVGATSVLDVGAAPIRNVISAFGIARGADPGAVTIPAADPW